MTTHASDMDGFYQGTLAGNVSFLSPDANLLNLAIVDKTIALKPCGPELGFADVHMAGSEQAARQSRAETIGQVLCILLGGRVTGLHIPDICLGAHFILAGLAGLETLATLVARISDASSNFRLGDGPMSITDLRLQPMTLLELTKAITIQ
jgi:hypothetical protein